MYGQNGPVPPVALFDLDDTLVDRDAAFARWAAAFVADRHLDPAAVAAICAADRHGYAPRAAMFGQLRADLGLDEPVEDLVAAYYPAYLSHFAPEPPVGAALGRLRDAGWRVVVLTNGPAAVQGEKVRRAGLEGLVDAVCASGAVGVAKPDPAIFHEALHLAGGPPEPGPAWMVGDNPRNDIGGARALGLRTVWIERGRRWPEPDWAPDHRVPDVPAAVAVLLALP